MKGEWSIMKKIYGILAVLLCFLFAGCGREESQYYEVASEKQSFFDVAANAVGAKFQGMQFHQGEPVQIWSAREAGKINIYLYKMDGSRELLLEGAPDGYDFGNGYIDKDGNYYHWNTNESVSGTDPSGRRLFSRRLSEAEISTINRICQPSDGRIYLLYTESGGGISKLGILDPATGEITKVSNAISGLSASTSIGSGGDGLCYLKEQGVEKVDAEAGRVEELWPFAGTTYILGLTTSYPVWDFQVKEDGSLELLRAGKKGENGILEALRKEPVEKGKKILTLRGTSFAYNKWLKECVQLFNQGNDQWYVALEECGIYSDPEDYAMQTSIEIAAGKGPDILYGDVLGSYEAGVFTKGGFADLAPYLGESGMKEEDFFPAAFGYYRDGGKIYSVMPKMDFSLDGHGSIVMDAAVLSGEGEPDIETLVDSLLACGEDAYFLRSAKSDDLLDLFLEGSESLWGMVDWETGTCNFNTELFRKIMEAAKRLEDSAQRGGATIEEAIKKLEEQQYDVQPLAERESYNLYRYLDQDLLREKGKVRAGILFDDGCHTHAEAGSRVMVNANTDKKEGAWEFIRFLLEEGQPAEYDFAGYPVSRKVFDDLMEKELLKERYVEDYEKYYKDNGTYLLNERRIQGIREILEDARFIPTRTQPILDIIQEEARTYFSGVKNMEEVCVLVGNRVQVYLDENPN